MALPPKYRREQLLNAAIAVALNELNDEIDSIAVQSPQHISIWAGAKRLLLYYEYLNGSDAPGRGSWLVQKVRIFDSHEDDLDSRFPIEGAIVGIDERTGDIVVYSGNAAASYLHGTWWPGIRVDKSAMLEFTSVRDPSAIRDYLKAASAALLKSLQDG